MKNLLTDKNLYYIGGVVRDEIIGSQSFDTDFCFEGDAIEFAKKQGLNVIKTNPDFGTVRVNLNEKEIDIASTRTEVYPRKGHLPEVYNIGCPLVDDLKRRDFTVNAMAKRTTDRELIDYFDGLNDIKNKTLRILHRESFIDDPTRIIRGLKFSVRFGFELCEETKRLQDEYLNNINYDMSYHRIRKELIETFNLNRAEAFDKFKEQKVYRLLGKNTKVPELKGIDIKNAIGNIESKHIWLIYIFPFLTDDNLYNIHPTRAEKRIFEWVNKLRYQEASNNTPIESIIIKRILDNA